MTDIGPTASARGRCCEPFNLAHKAGACFDQSWISSYNSRSSCLMTTHRTVMVATVMADEMKNAVAISLNHSQFDANRAALRRHGAPQCVGEICRSAMLICTCCHPSRTGLYALCAKATRPAENAGWHRICHRMTGLDSSQRLALPCDLVSLDWIEPRASRRSS